jgi:hypothetical protein
VTDIDLERRLTAVALIESYRRHRRQHDDDCDDVGADMQMLIDGFDGDDHQLRYMAVELAMLAASALDDLDNPDDDEEAQEFLDRYRQAAFEIYAEETR